MKQKTFVTSLIYFSYIFVMFLPAYFQNRVFNLLENGLFLVVAATLFYFLYKPGRMALLISLYYVFVVCMSVIYRNIPVDIHLFVSNAKVIVLILMTDFMFRRERKAALNVLFFTFLFFVLSDFISLVLYPNGLYVTEIKWNEWSSSYERQWILGNKNNRYIHYMLLLLVTYLRYADKKKRIGVIGAVLCIISVSAAFMVKSSTGIVAMLMAVLGVVLYALGKRMKITLRLRYVYIAYFIAFGLVMFSQSEVLNDLMMNIFEKDASFSNRRNAWEISWNLITARPLFGNGLISDSAAQKLLGSKSFVNAHNAILQTLLNGGIVGLGLLTACFVEISKRIYRVQRKNEKAFLTAFLVALLVETLLEVVLNTSTAWLFMMVLYYADTFMTAEAPALSVETISDRQVSPSVS